MRVKCHSCAAGYTLPESKLRPGRRLQFSCRRCGARIQVAIPDKDEAEDAEEPAQSAARSRMGSSLSGLSERPRFAPARKPSSPAIAKVGAPVPAPSRPDTEAVKAREKERLAGSVKATRSEEAVRWFVANEDGSYKKWRASDLDVAMRGGLVAADTLVWRKGMAEWLPADETDEWRDIYEETAPDKAEEPAAPDDNLGAEQPAPTRAMSVVDDPPAEADTEPPDEPEDDADTDGAGHRFDQAATVAGAVRPKTNQRAVSLPIVRNRTSGAHEAADGRPQRGELRPRSGNADGFGGRPRSAGTPMDPGPRSRDDGNWAPATDTYTGPRGRLTHRIGSEGERASLLAHIDREQSLQRNLRRWQWISLATATGALLAFLLALYAMLGWQEAAQHAADCQATEVKSKAAAEGSDKGARKARRK